MSTRIARIKEIAATLGVSTRTIHRWYKTGSFPPPIRLGPNAVGWRVGDVEAWVEARPPAEVGS